YLLLDALLHWEQPAVPAAPVPAPRPRRWRWVWRSLGGLAAAAAAVLLAGLLWPPPPAPPRRPPAPRPGNTAPVPLRAPPAAEAVWADTELPTRPGAPLPPGWIRLKSGYAHLEFYSGATVILQGPADFQLVSRNEAYCARGRLWANVPPQAQGFTIGSPKTE